jgi:large subunit ribosomal protein L28
MSRRCSVTGKVGMRGNNVSHANNKTRRSFLPNLHQLSFKSEILGSDVSLKVTSHGLRTIEHNGGLDAYLLSTGSRKLTEEMVKLKKKVKKKMAVAS